MLCAPLLTFLDAATFAHRSNWHTRKFSAHHHLYHLLLTLYAHFVQAPSANALIEELNEVVGPNRERNLRQMLGFEGLQAETNQPLLLNQSSSGTLWVALTLTALIGSGVTVLVSYGKSLNLNANPVI